MSAWVVRAGQRGENEHWNIEHGRMSVGWPEVGDLSPATSREDVRRRVEEAYPATAPPAGPTTPASSGHSGTPSARVTSSSCR